jgi:putative zinc finger/helix-turn-helix YgiT family protein
VKFKFKCVNCGQSDLEEAIIQASGDVRGEEYTVEMNGLVCLHCGYRTIKGPDMPEFGRLLADKYRAAHGLLTSDQIRERRLRLGLSQQAFADYLKRGVASVKRWELGRIQELDNDRHIREMTQRTTSTQAYVAAMFPNVVGGTTNVRVGSCQICSGNAQRQTTSQSAADYFSSGDSTSSPSVVERFAHARQH